MEFKCQKCKQVLHSEEEATKHSDENKGHNRFDFKTIGVITEIN